MIKLYFSDIFSLYPLSLKSLQSHKSEVGVFLLIKMTLDPTQGWGLVARRTNHVIRGLKLSVALTSWGGRSVGG